jgi:hypothetical protein
MALADYAESYQQDFDNEKHVLKIRKPDFRLISSS